MPGHALLHAQFTATSMIGMIALDRHYPSATLNSCWWISIIYSCLPAWTFRDAVIRSAATRAQPDCAHTALAAMLGALFILDDPNLQRPGDLVDLRHPGVHGADPGRDSVLYYAVYCHAHPIAATEPLRWSITIDSWQLTRGQWPGASSW